MLTADTSDVGGLRRTIKYRPDIDGLRAVAVMSIVACHSRIGWAKGGYVGVDVFFVISGYLIGSLVYKEIRGHSFSLRKFYARRAKRILPALFGVLLFSYVAAVLLLSPTELKGFSESALAAIASTSNFYFWHAVNYFDSDSGQLPFLMTWSLGIEEQFYLLFPMLMLLIRKRQWQTQAFGIGALASLSLAASIWGAAYHTVSSFYLLPTRAWELAVGVLLAILEANRNHAREPLLPKYAAHGMSVVGLALIGSAILFFDDSIPFPGYAALLPVSGAVMLISARHGAANRVLSWRPIVFVGLISYSWYLWHWPMLSFVRNVLGSTIPETIAVALGILSFLLAVLSYKFIEQPFRASIVTPPLLLKRYAAALAIAMIPAAVFFATKGLPQRNRDAQALDETVRQQESEVCLDQLTEVHLRLSAPCIPPSKGRAIALMGDSHAATLTSTLRSISMRSGYRLVVFTKSGCPTLQGISPSYFDDPGFPPGCFAYNRESLDYVTHDPSIQVVVIAGYWQKPFQFDTTNEGYLAEGEKVGPFNRVHSLELLHLGLDQLVVRLEQAGKTVYIVQDNPSFSFNPDRVILNRLIWARHALASLLRSSTLRYANGVAPEYNPADAERIRSIIFNVVRDHPATQLIDLHTALCNGAGCRFAQGNNALYIDDSHLSWLGAQVALEGLKFP